MDTGQFYTLIAAIAAAAGVIARAIAGAIKLIGERLIVSVDRNTEAWIAGTNKITELATKMDIVSDFVHENTPIEVPIRRRTPPGGNPAGSYGPMRPPTRER